MKNKGIYIITAVVVVIALAIGGTVYWTGANNYVAKVGEQKITKAEYNFFLNTVKAQMEQEVQTTGGDVKAFWNSKVGGEDAREVAKNKALEEAQKFEIQMIKAKENNITLTKEEATGVTKSIDDQVKQIGKVEADKQLKEMYNITVNDYKQLAKDMTLISKFVEEQMKKGEPTDEQAKKYFDDNKEKLGKVTARHVLLSTQDENGLPLPEEKQQEKKKTADEVLAKVKAGEDIGALAKQYSEDPGSKDNNGEYTFAKSDMVKEFGDWAFSAKVGDVGLVKTDYGYHVMKLMKILTYDELVNDVKNSYKQDKYSESLNNWKKESQYSTVKNQKVFDSITV